MACKGKNSYIITSDGNFISLSDISYGQDIRYIDLNPDVLVHWKYIKRVKLPSGKYRYYYDNSYLKKQEEKIKDYQLESFKNSAEVVNAEDDMRRAMSTSNTKEYLKAYAERNAARYRAETASKAANKAIKKYGAMKVTSIAAKTIAKGLNVVSNLLYKLFGKNKKK